MAGELPTGWRNRAWNRNRLRSASVLLALVIPAMLLPLVSCPRSSTGKVALPPSARAGKTAAEEQPREYIRIGVLLPLTGSAQRSGVSMQKGIDLALQRINASGGIRALNLLVVYRDTGGDATLAGEEAKGLLEEALPDSIVCGGNVEEAEAVAEVAGTYGVPVLVVASGVSKPTRAADGSIRPRVFRISLTDELRARALASCAAKELRAKRVGIVLDAASAGGQHLKKMLAREFSGYFPDVAVSDEGSYQHGSAESLHSLIERLKEDTPDTLVLLGASLQSRMVVKDLRAAGIQAELLAWNQLPENSQKGPAVAAAEGVILLSCFAPDEPADAATTFSSAYEDAYKESPDAPAALGYDALGLLADAITRARSMKPEAVAVALAQTEDFAGATGTITMDASHNAHRRVVMLKVEEGELHFMRPLELSKLPDATSNEQPKSE
ncbi:MAG: hypothetical protein B1H03_03890 [Planctomycetales bacterium 4484_113]|nr:MAG: hypothetical protein B1H03_03890 [Planctomycetales bacterium 4484_113]